jgi:hypothetical protein
VGVACIMQVNTQHALAMVRRTHSARAVVAVNCGDAACAITVFLRGLCPPATVKPLLNFKDPIETLLKYLLNFKDPFQFEPY